VASASACLLLSACFDERFLCFFLCFFSSVPSLFGCATAAAFGSIVGSAKQIFS